MTTDMIRLGFFFFTGVYKRKKNASNFQNKSLLYAALYVLEKYSHKQHTILQNYRIPLIPIFKQLACRRATVTITVCKRTLLHKFYHLNVCQLDQTEHMHYGIHHLSLYFEVGAEAGYGEALDRSSYGSYASSYN